MVKNWNKQRCEMIKTGISVGLSTNHLLSKNIFSFTRSYNKMDKNWLKKAQQQYI